MLFFNFVEKTSIVCTICALLFLVFTTFYTSNLKQRIGLFYFLAGIISLIFTSAIQQNVEYFYSHAVSIKMFIFFEMTMVLISSLLLINAASYILLGTPLSINLLFSFISGGFVLIFYSIFIANNAHIVDNMRQILPLIGMSYVFLSFISSIKPFFKPGNLLAAFSSLGLIILMAQPMFTDYNYPWYLPVIFIVTLSFSYMLMSNENFKKQIIQLNLFQEKSSTNLRNIIKSSPFPIVLSRLGDDTLILANNNALKLFGLSEKEIYRYHFKDFFIDAENRKLLTERLEFNREVHDFEILVRTASGNTPFWLLLSANVIEYNNDIVLYSAFQDITLRKRHETVLQSQADRDPLTSIYNRRYFENAVTQKIKQAHINKVPFAIFMIDADKFKSINDIHGHKTGDKVLIELAAICERTLRQEDLVARYGGEEFVAFVNNVDKNTATMVANRLKKAITDSVVYSDEKVPITFSASIGIAPSGVSDNVSVMIKMADDAMYLAKQNGRNRIEMYSPENMEKIKSQEKPTYNSQIHPAFTNEEKQEISLLDGIETVSITED